MQNLSESWVGNILLRNMEGSGTGLNNNNEDFTFKGKVVSIKRMKQKKLITKKSWKSWKKLVKLKKWLFQVQKSNIFCSQLVSFQGWFNWKDFFIGLLLNLLPTALDISTDFNLAREMNLRSMENITRKIVYNLPILGERTTNIEAQFASFTYLFISLPGVILFMKMFFLKAKRMWTSYIPDFKACHLVLNLIALSLTLAAAQTAIVLATISVQEPFFILAILSAVFTLTVNLARVFIHSEEVKELALRVTTAEEQYESAFQIHLFFLNWLIGAQPTENAAGLWMGQMASVLMVAKVAIHLPQLLITLFVTSGWSRKFGGP